MKDLLLGTWNYKVSEAPFGFRTGKAIFFEDGGDLKVKLKIYGLTIKAKNLTISGKEITFAADVDIEKILVKLELEGSNLVGLVHTSEGTMSIELAKKGSEIRGLGAEEDLTADDDLDLLASKEWMRKKKKQKDLCKSIEPDRRIHTFYYGWYGNPEFDEEYKGWNHAIVPHAVETTWNDTPPHSGGNDVGANYYPQLGCYSSRDPEVIDIHMQQIREAGIGVVALSWWGKDHFTDRSLPTILDTAQSYGLKIAFHIEPFYSTVEEFKTHLKYIGESYNQHPAIFRFNGLPLYYLYNSFKLDHHEWFSMLNPDSERTIRNTALDGVFISLWTTQFDGEFTVRSGFDGFYTYFASDGFAYGSTTANWPYLSQFAEDKKLIYIPCVGPGYVDTRIRPWNERNTKDRDSGRYYEEMMKNAVDTNPDFIRDHIF